MTTGATSVRNLDLWPLVAYAASRGYIQDSWYLISVESGFELWRGGVGLATDVVLGQGGWRRLTLAWPGIAAQTA